MKKRILLCSQWVDRYRPLVEDLLKKGNFEVCCEENFVMRFGTSHPDLKSYEPLLPPFDPSRYRREARERMESLAPLIQRSVYRHIESAGDYRCLEDRRKLTYELQDSLAQALYMVDAFEALHRLINLDLLIVDGPGIRQQTWLAAAKVQRVPSLEIYHGAIHVKPELLPRRTVQADFMAIGSALIREVYLQLGMPPERLRVTGLPSAPQSDLSKEKALAFLRDKYGVDPRRKIVLFYPSYDSGDTFEFLFDLSTGYQVEYLRWTAAAVRRLNEEISPGAQLVIKRHPTMAQAGWDDEEAYRFIARQAGLEPVMTDPHESNPLLLAAADAVLPIKFSSTISESLNADKPVILLPVGRDWLHDALLQSGTIVCADDETSLRQALERCLYDADFRNDLAEARRKYKAEYPHVPSSEAVGNIVRYIDDILTGRGETPVMDRRSPVEQTSRVSALPESIVQ